jgi:hypothetical protein
LTPSQKKKHTKTSVKKSVVSDLKDSKMMTVSALNIPSHHRKQASSHIFLTQRSVTNSPPLSQRHMRVKSKTKSQSRAMSSKIYKTVESTLSHRSMAKSKKSNKSLKRSISCLSKKSGYGSACIPRSASAKRSDLGSSNFYQIEKEKYAEDLRQKQQANQVSTLKLKVKDQQKEILEERQKSLKLQDMVEKLITKLKVFYQSQQRQKENVSTNEGIQNVSSVGTVSVEEYNALLQKFEKSEQIRNQQKSLIFEMRKEMQSKTKSSKNK